MEKELSVMVCPYDNSHKIDRSRFQRHIVKCAKNFPPKFKETCPFNATHIMFQSELEEHIDMCPDKRYLTPEYYCSVKNHGSMKSCPPSEAEKTLTCDESWDGNMIDDRMNDFSDTSSMMSDVDEFALPSVPIDSSKPLRAPKGYGLPLMLEFSEESGLDEVESIASSWAVGGRGRKAPQDIPIHSKLGSGRGRGAKFM